MTPARSAGVEVTWTREKIIQAIQRWVALYGETPRAADWNPSSAKYCKQEWRIERYYLGDPETGDPWPSLNVAKRPFNRSLDQAIMAAGFTPARPGPQRKTPPAPQSAEEATRVRDAEARARAAERKLAVAERRAERLSERVAALKARPAKVKTKVVREKVVRERTVRADVLARARARVEKADAAVAAARADARAAQAALRDQLKATERDAARTAAALVNARSELAEMNSEMKEMRGEVARAQDRVAAVEAVLERERESLRAQRPVVTASAGEVADAVRQREAALRREESAEQRAAAAERRERETVALVTGEPRRLTAAEIKKLRRDGMAGPAVLADAIKKLARARAGRGSMAEALTDVASAAVSWKDRL